jgi:hypothetical protein
MRSLGNGDWVMGNGNIMFLYCGGGVQRPVYKKWIFNSIYTHNPHILLIYIGFNYLYTFLYPQFSQYLHNKYVQIQSVNNHFYTFYTGTITTTIYN